jgi:hypothetical protein
MTEPHAAVHYEVDYSPTGGPPWFRIRTSTSAVEAQRLAMEALREKWSRHTRTRSVVAAKAVEVVETFGGESVAP